MTSFQLLAVGPSVNPPFEFAVVGTGFEGRASIIRRRCVRGQRVELVREPNNPHDSNAIAVHLVWKTDGGKEVTDQIGYVPAALAEEMCDLLFRHALTIKQATINRVTAPPDFDAPRVTVRVEGALAEGITQMELP
jgi:hypothetical protein